MQVAPSGVPLVFEYCAYDEEGSLFVAMKVFDITTIGSPVLVATTAMAHLFGGAYVAEFTPSASAQYLVHKAVYTDGTFTTLDPNRSPASESFLASAAAGGVLTPADVTNIVNGVWNEAQAAHVAAGTFGRNLDERVSSRASQGSVDTIDAIIANINANTVPSVIAQDVWNAARGSFAVVGSFGESLQGVLSPARALLIDNLSRLDVVVSTRAVQTTVNDILADTNYLEANFTAGRFASIDRVDVAVSTRASSGAVASLPSSAQNAFAVWEELLAAHIGAGSAGKKLGDISAAAAPSAAAVAAAVWDEPAAGHVVAGSFGLRFDAAISTRASQVSLDDAKGGGFATGTHSLVAIRAKVDTLPTSAGDATAANQTAILASLSSKAQQATLLAVQAGVAAIPTTPLLASDIRLNHLDADISTRASQVSLDAAMGAGFVAGDDLHSIKLAVSASVDLSPVLAGLSDIKGAGFVSGTDSLAANADSVAAATAAANAAAAAASAASAAVASKASQVSVNAVAAAVAAIPTNPALTTDPRLGNLDTPISSRADAVALGQLMGPGFNPATDSARAIRILLSALNPGDATYANQVAILAAISTLATASGLGAVAAAIAAIPTNPLLTTDARVNRLDVNVSSRASDADMQLIKGPGFIAGDDNLHEIKQAIPAVIDISPVMAKLAEIEGAGFSPSLDALKPLNDTAKAERATIKADTSALLASGEPF